MILQGNEDLRVVKTIEGIKAAFEELICEKDYERITVKELCERARINKKTFYHYYETLDFLLAELQVELSQGYIERIKDYELPRELDKVNREFFLYSVEQGLAYEKISCSVSYAKVRNEMIEKVYDASWGRSKSFRALSELERRQLMNFITTTSVGCYRQWVEDGKKQSVEELIELSNRLMLGGVNGFFGKQQSKH